MSLKLLEEFTAELPFALQEQVADYARSIRDAADDICGDAGVNATTEMVEQLMWVAVLRRLHAIVNSAFWTLDTSNRLLREQGIGAPSVGATDYSVDSEMYRSLASLQRDLEALIQQLGATNLIRLPWSEVAQVLADERRRS